MFLGLVTTYFWVPESKGKDLDEFEEGYTQEITSRENLEEDIPLENRK